MNVPLLDLKKQYNEIRNEILEATTEVYASQQFILGPKVRELEKKVAEYCNCDYAVGVSSGTDALLLALMALNIFPGDEVITTPYTFRATVNVIKRMGARPVFVDIDRGTFNINAERIEAKITGRTRAIIPVHLFGQCADMAYINQYGIPVIEDACQAIGAEQKGHRAGSMGDMGCFSFFPSKNLGGFGDGGMVTTSDEELYVKLKWLRVHGGNFRLDELQAAILLVKLKYLDKWIFRRQRNADHYRKGLYNTDGIGLPVEEDGRHVYNQFVIRSGDRDALRLFLSQNGIGTKVYYDEIFANLAEAKKAAAESLSIPVYPEMTEEQIDYVLQTIHRFL
jgi:dTDP-4-amino-4,6-dideoxygalactose transaminase